MVYLKILKYDGIVCSCKSVQSVVHFRAKYLQIISFFQAITTFFPLSYKYGLGMTCGPSNMGRGIICSIECAG